MAIQKNPFLKYLVKDKKEDIFHSSGYAKAQSGASLGAASSESFQVRVNINQNRQRVRGYNDSRIMTETRNRDMRAKTFTPPEGDAAGGGATGLGGNAGLGGDAAKRAAMPVKNPGISLKK